MFILSANTLDTMNKVKHAADTILMQQFIFNSSLYYTVIIFLTTTLTHLRPFVLQDLHEEQSPHPAPIQTLSLFLWTCPNPLHASQRFAESEICPEPPQPLHFMQ